MDGIIEKASSSMLDMAVQYPTPRLEKGVFGLIGTCLGSNCGGICKSKCGESWNCRSHKLEKLGCPVTNIVELRVGDVSFQVSRRTA